MEIRHTVRRGDSLWSLAHRYLRNGTRYPQILNFHNQAAASSGLRLIDEPDLIFVGETILIPQCPKLSEPGSGTKYEGDCLPIPLNLKVTYAIGRDTPPILYTTGTGNFTIKTEMSGEISIEIASNDRYRHSLELFMSKNPIQAKQKLYDAYDPALVALTAKPEMVFESGRVKIKAPIATNANLGPYTIGLNNVTPLHASGSIKPHTISGTLELGRRNFKYSADVDFKVDVIRHQRPRSEHEPVTKILKESELQRENFVREAPTSHTTKWEQTVTEKGVIVAVVLVAISAVSILSYRIATKGGLLPAPISLPFTHTIDRQIPGA